MVVGTPLGTMSIDRHVEVLVVGAGLSGIGAAHYLRTRLPEHSFAILEARDALGGTWDLFRYPGVRSDSDMHTLGYSFRPWAGDVALADGPSIKAYIEATARACGLESHIRFRHRALRAEWSSAQARWTVWVRVGDEPQPVAYTCRFLYLCSGYYDYAGGYQPDWPERDAFGGVFVHPQRWPEDLDYRDRRVVVIGSGATAVTLVPAMAREAAHVTMLQRTPTYIAAVPGRDAIARALYRLLPARLAHGAIRWKNVLLQMLFYNVMRRWPAQARARVKRMIHAELGERYRERDFDPPYDPWDQRFCLVPDGDLFAAIRTGDASIVTGEIERFTPSGLRLRSGEEIDADVVVSATGLNVRLMGGMELAIDGRTLRLNELVSYKGMMFCGVPNLALALGYTNASWTLKCELTSRYVCRVLAYMDRHGFAVCTPAEPGDEIAREPAIDLTAGYIRRAEPTLPKQGARAPWKLHQNYALDLASLRYGRVDDGVMRFARA